MLQHVGSSQLAILLNTHFCARQYVVHSESYGGKVFDQALIDGVAPYERTTARFTAQTAIH